MNNDIITTIKALPDDSVYAVLESVTGKAITGWRQVNDLKALALELERVKEQLAKAMDCINRYAGDDSWACSSKCYPFCTHVETEFILPSGENGYDYARKTLAEIEGMEETK